MLIFILHYIQEDICLYTSDVSLKWFPYDESLLVVTSLTSVWDVNMETFYTL